MNYYERHIGDYIRDTVSLTMLEDGAYNRLIDQYYQSERPLPLDRKLVYRLARATSAPERKAVDFVLDTYFVKTDAGFEQKRVQAEIERYWERGQSQESKRENDRERQQRARERRKTLFEALRGHGIVPEFNVPTRQLSAMLEAAESGNVTGGVTRDSSRDNHEHVTRDNTATQSPDTRHQTPKEKQEGDRAHDASAYGTIAKALRQRSVEVQPGNPDFRAWVDNGLTEDEAIAGLEIARTSKPAPERMPWGYLSKVLATQRKTAAAGIPAKADRPAAQAERRSTWNDKLQAVIRQADTAQPREIDMGTIDATGTLD